MVIDIATSQLGDLSVERSIRNHGCLPRLADASLPVLKHFFCAELLLPPLCAETCLLTCAHREGPYSEPANFLVWGGSQSL